MSRIGIVNLRVTLHAQVGLLGRLALVQAALQEHRMRVVSALQGAWNQQESPEAQEGGLLLGRRVLLEELAHPAESRPDEEITDHLLTVFDPRIRSGSTVTSTRNAPP